MRCPRSLALVAAIVGFLLALAPLTPVEADDYVKPRNRPLAPEGTIFRLRQTPYDAAIRRQLAESGSPIIPDLAAILNDEMELEPIRAAAATILNDIGNVEATRALTDFFMSDAIMGGIGRQGFLGDPGSRDLETAVLRGIARAGNRNVIPRLWHLIREVPQLRDLAISSLGTVGDESAVKDILPYLEDKDPAVRSSAVQALSQIGGERAFSAIHQGLQATEGYRQVRFAQIEALEQTKGPQSAEWLTAFVLNNDKEDYYHSQCIGRAWTALMNIGQPAAPFLARILHKLNPGRVAFSLRLLGEAKLIETAPILKAYLKDKDSQIRIAAAEALSDLGEGNRQELFTMLLASEDSKYPKAYLQEAVQLPSAASPHRALISRDGHSLKLNFKPTDIVEAHLHGSPDCPINQKMIPPLLDSVRSAEAVDVPWHFNWATMTGDIVLTFSNNRRQKVLKEDPFIWIDDAPYGGTHAKAFESPRLMGIKRQIQEQCVQEIARAGATSNDITQRMHAAQAYAKMGDFSHAAAVYEAVTRDFPSSKSVADGQIQRALVDTYVASIDSRLINQKIEYEPLLRGMEEAFAEFPNAVRDSWRRWLGNHYVATGEWEKAARTYSGNAPELRHVKRILDFRARGMIAGQETKEQLESLLKLYEEMPYAWGLADVRLRLLKDYPEKDGGPNRSWIAGQWIILGEWERAAEQLKHISEKYPDSQFSLRGDAKYFLALCYQNLGRYDEAAKLYKSLDLQHFERPSRVERRLRECHSSIRNGVYPIEFIVEGCCLFPD
ncbi:MAG: HEAT repeat domain-containing protein [Elusimicrobiota bacterium]